MHFAHEDFDQLLNVHDLKRKLVIFHLRMLNENYLRGFLLQNIYVLIGFLTLSSVGTGLLLPCLNTMITGSVDKEERGMITSLYSSLRFLGVAFGPPLFSWMMDRSNELVFIVTASLSFITLALVFFLIKPDKKLSEAG